MVAFYHVIHVPAQGRDLRVLQVVPEEQQAVWTVEPRAVRNPQNGPGAGDSEVVSLSARWA